MNLIVTSFVATSLCFVSFSREKKEPRFSKSKLLRLYSLARTLSFGVS